MGIPVPVCVAFPAILLNSPTHGNLHYKTRMGNYGIRDDFRIFFFVFVMVGHVGLNTYPGMVALRISISQKQLFIG